MQRPVYYMSRVLRDAETRYTKLEKSIYALLIAARRLRPYFQGHTITLLTDQPIKAVLHRADASGRIAKWAIELTEFDINYQPRPSIKAQILADFIVECTIPDEAELEQGEAEIPWLQPNPPEERTDLPGDCWVLYVDGSSNSSGAGAGLILVSPEGTIAEYALRFEFPATNNGVEYEALMAGLRIAKELEADRLQVYSDSQLVVGQVGGSYEAREESMIKYLEKVRGLIPAFGSFNIQQIPRAENTRADLLSKLATLAPNELPKEVYFEVLKCPSTEESQSTMQINHEPCWIDPLTAYLADGTLPRDPKEARKLRNQASRYVLYEGKLYKRSHSLPLLRCLRPSEADFALWEVHEGICGSHLGARSLSYKLLRQGYYWPTLYKDSLDYVRRCDRCQRNANIQRQPASELVPLSAPWPFAQWGMDILGPFPMASGQRKFLLVAIDYFTKWVEAEPLAKITEAKVQDFVWKSIVCRFGLPRTIITDNGRQFAGARFAEFCEDLNISHNFTSVAHPQANGEAEVTNRTLLQGIKARLERARGTWVDELYHILWAYRTTQRLPTGETPFALAFGTEAVIPIELKLPSARVVAFDAQRNSHDLRTNLDLLEERREGAQVRMAAYRRRVARYYNSRVKSKVFRVGDLVLRQAAISQPRNQGKLAPN